MAGTLIGTIGETFVDSFGLGAAYTRWIVYRDTPFLERAGSAVRQGAKNFLAPAYDRYIAFDEIPNLEQRFIAGIVYDIGGGLLTLASLGYSLATWHDTLHTVLVPAAMKYGYNFFINASINIRYWQRERNHRRR